MASIPPVKTPVGQRVTPTTAQSVRAAQEKQALVVDPLMPLREAVPMLGNPSYSLLQKWIRTGVLRVWRLPGDRSQKANGAGRGQYRVRLSEVQRFRSENEVNHGTE
jgi:hypothetical protein